MCRPKMMISTPAILPRSRSWPPTNCPIAVAEAPSAMNTSENPSDERERRDEDAAAGLGRRGAAVTRQDASVQRHAGNERQVARHERQHAGRDERQDAADERREQRDVVHGRNFTVSDSAAD